MTIGVTPKRGNECVGSSIGWSGDESAFVLLGHGGGCVFWDENGPRFLERLTADKRADSDKPITTNIEVIFRTKQGHSWA